MDEDLSDSNQNRRQIRLNCSDPNLENLLGFIFIITKTLAVKVKCTIRMKILTTFYHLVKYKLQMTSL